MVSFRGCPKNCWSARRHGDAKAIGGIEASQFPRRGRAIRVRSARFGGGRRAADLIQLMALRVAVSDAALEVGPYWCCRAAQEGQTARQTV